MRLTASSAIGRDRSGVLSTLGIGRDVSKHEELAARVVTSTKAWVRRAGSRSTLNNGL